MYVMSSRHLRSKGSPEGVSKGGVAVSKGVLQYHNSFSIVRTMICLETEKVLGFLEQVR